MRTKGEENVAKPRLQEKVMGHAIVMQSPALDGGRIWDLLDPYHISAIRFMRGMDKDAVLKREEIQSYLRMYVICQGAILRAAYSSAHKIHKDYCGLPLMSAVLSACFFVLISFYLIDQRSELRRRLHLEEYVTARLDRILNLHEGGILKIDPRVFSSLWIQRTEVNIHRWWVKAGAELASMMLMSIFLFVSCARLCSTI